MREIPLTRGRVAVVDDEDYGGLMEHKWYFDGTYARRLNWNGPGQRRNAILMHRVVAGAKPGECVDHANGDGLDNRRANLRVCTHQENMRNVKKMATWRGRQPTSQYKGVYRRYNGKWAAQVKQGGKQVYLGTFAAEDEAVKAYREAASREYGEFFRVG